MLSGQWPPEFSLVKEEILNPGSCGGDVELHRLGP